MNKREKIAQLKNFQAKADAIRKELGINPPHEIIFLGEGGMSNGLIVVEADGFGGATLRVVEGRYPLDHITRFEKWFPNERKAGEASERMAFHGVPAGVVLGEAADFNS